MEQCIANDYILAAMVINEIKTDRSCFKTVAKTNAFGHARARTLERTMDLDDGCSKIIEKLWACSLQAAYLAKELHSANVPASF